MDTKETGDATLAPSKSQLKRDARALFELARDLVAISPRELDALPVERDLREAIDFARSIRSNVARKRQVQYIAKMMRRRDVESILEAMDAARQEARKLTVRHHRVETWRDIILRDGDAALAALLAERDPSAIQTLRNLARNARRESERGKPPAAARKLFRLLRDMDAEQALPPAP